MQRIIPFLAFTILSLFATAQPEQPGRIWILFKDRNPAHASLHPQFQTDRFNAASRRRRILRAESPWDETDLPVDSEYVQKVRNAGAEVYRETRWLNGVSAYCDNACRARVLQLPFVSEVRPVLIYRRPLDSISRSTRLLTSIQKRGKRLRYGQSADQLKQINVPPIHKKGYAGQGEIVAIFDTGFRKDHIAFKNHEIVAEKDFVFNDGNVTDGTDTDLHGTATWSCVGGEAPGRLYGPAYRAQVLLAVTEDIRTETEVEEDNWVAALEWADENGATVVSSSLGYPDFYLANQLNGKKAITSRAASTAARKGILLVNSAGNEGPRKSTIAPPADARKILSVGAVDPDGSIAFFSSRGPTADGRIKPEVVARGEGTFVATSITSSSFDYLDGTSFSCPLVAGAAAVLFSAHPGWNPLQVRESFLNTAAGADHPNNDYGWGLIDLQAAVDYLPKKIIVIEYTPPSRPVSDSQPLRIQSRIRAQRGLNLDSPAVSWSTQAGGPFQQIPLLPVAGQADTFAASIPPQIAGTDLFYFLTAADRKGKTEKLPLDAPDSTFHVTFR